MKCTDCRKHLNPYLDDELEIRENLSILEHLNSCRECREIFTLEEMSWNAVRGRLQQERMPEAMRQRIGASLSASDRVQWRRRAVAGIGTIAAGILVFVLVTQTSLFGDPRNDGDPSHAAGGEAHDHGLAVRTIVASFEGTMMGAAARKVDVFNPTYLASARYRTINAEKHPCFLSWICARKREIFEEITGTTTNMAYREEDICGVNVYHTIFDFKGRTIGLFKLSSKQARKVGLDHIEPGKSQSFQITECGMCKVIVVAEEATVWILVTAADKAQPAIDFAQRVF